MSYLRTSLGQIPFHQSGGSPQFGMPIPIQAPGPGVPGPMMPTSIYPTSNLRWGDPITVTGPFAGQFQGNVRVKFAGAPWQAPAILGPFQATVQVPDGAQTGACVVEINGRVAFGTQCSVVPGGALRGRLSERRGTRAWKDFGPKDLSGTLDGYSPMGETDVALRAELAEAVREHAKALANLNQLWKQYPKPGNPTGDGLKAMVEKKLKQWAGKVESLRSQIARGEAVARGTAARKEAIARHASPTVSSASVPAATSLPVLLVVGVGAAAVLGYVFWNRSRAQ